MGELEPNIERIREVIEQIELHPERWDQLTYGSRVPADVTACRSVHCFAGWTVLTFAPERAVWSRCCDGCSDESFNVRDKDGGVIGPFWVAADLLGLTTDEAQDIFE